MTKPQDDQPPRNRFVEDFRDGVPPLTIIPPKKSAAKKPVEKKPRKGRK